MIQTLRRRFLLIAMLSLTGTLCVTGIAINLANYIRVTGQMDAVIDFLYENDGVFPLPEVVLPDVTGGFQVTEETPFETRYCIVLLTEEMEVGEMDIEHIAALDQERVSGLVGSILENGHSRGYTGYYRYKVYNSSGKTVIVILDCFLQLQSAHRVLQLTLLVFSGCVAVMFFLLLFLSDRAIRPFVRSLERQKRFLTDISHELKTPLGIISANMGVLEVTRGKDEWTESTRTQVNRMDRLIRDLTELSRSEEGLRPEAFQNVPISRLAQETARDFCTLAESEGKKLSCHIEPELCMKGQEDSLIRLMDVLLDNAVKYCDPQGCIRFELYRKSRQIVLATSNPCKDFPCGEFSGKGSSRKRFSGKGSSLKKDFRRDSSPEPLSLLFDRFYRPDHSRARSSGGYGIGLSIARAVAEAHGGRIRASREGINIVFTVLLPRKGQA